MLLQEYGKLLSSQETIDRNPLSYLGPKFQNTKSCQKQNKKYLDPALKNLRWEDDKSEAILDFIMRSFLNIIEGEEGRVREGRDRRIGKKGKKRKGFDAMSRSGELNLASSSMIYI